VLSSRTSAPHLGLARGCASTVRRLGRDVSDACMILMVRAERQNRRMVCRSGPRAVPSTTSLVHLWP